LCVHCKEPYEVKGGDVPQGVALESPVIYKPKGCEKCNFTGYRGRTLIAEVILMNEDLRNALLKAATPMQIMEIAKKSGTLSLLESGLKKVEEGITSLEEVLSATIVY
jgi:type IV pilus assembly protein PilB